MLLTLLITFFALLIFFTGLIVLAGWREKVNGEDYLHAISYAKEVSPKPAYSKRIPIENLLKRFKGQRDTPIFVVPAAELRRVNVEGAGDFDRRIDDK